MKTRENIYKETLSKLKNATSNNNNENYQVSPLRNNNINQGTNNNSYYTYNQRNGKEMNNSPYFEKDDSFKYSYYLIDNLKNSISNVDFQKNLTNI